MADCYLEILWASPEWDLHRAAGKGCFNVDLAIRIADEDDVSVPMFNGAARGAVKMLSAPADTIASAGCIYDNLDQRLALVVVLTNDAVFTLVWDWEQPLGQQTPRALRFPR